MVSNSVKVVGDYVNTILGRTTNGKFGKVVIDPFTTKPVSAGTAGQALAVTYFVGGVVIPVKTAISIKNNVNKKIAIFSYSAAKVVYKAYNSTMNALSNAYKSTADYFQNILDENKGKTDQGISDFSNWLMGGAH